MFESLGICLVLGALITINALLTIPAAAIWRQIRGRAEIWPASRRARALFYLRVFPSFISAVYVLVLILPAYIAYEPRRSAEPVGLKLGVIAGLSAVGLTLAIWRGLAAWMATYRLVRNWMRAAEPIGFDRLPIYRLRHQFPVVAVVGVFRPKLFITDYLFQSLTKDELAAAIAHETGHIAARDNLKRAALRVCRDALAIFPFGQSLDSEWAEASEAAADEYAVSGGGGIALDLASTLVKIARLIPKGLNPAAPANAALVVNGPDGIAERVRRLTRLAATDKLPPEGRKFTAWISVCFAAILGSAILLASNSSTLMAVHNLIEIAVLRLR